MRGSLHVFNFSMWTEFDFLLRSGTKESLEELNEEPVSVPTTTKQDAATLNAYSVQTQVPNLRNSLVCSLVLIKLQLKKI